MNSAQVRFGQEQHHRYRSAVKAKKNAPGGVCHELHLKKCADGHQYGRDHQKYEVYHEEKPEHCTRATASPECNRDAEDGKKIVKAENYFRETPAKLAGTEDQVPRNLQRDEPCKQAC